MLSKQYDLVVVVSEKVKKATSHNCGDEDKTLLHTQPVYYKQEKQQSRLPTLQVIEAIFYLHTHLLPCVTIDREHTRAYHFVCQFSRIRSPSKV